jgi:hypothetical protein
VVALGEKQGQSYVFKVQAFAPNDFVPLWTFIPNDKQGLQMAFAVAVGLFGEVYAGGIAKGTTPRSPSSAARRRAQPGGTNPAHAVSTRPVASTNAGP